MTRRHLRRLTGLAALCLVPLIPACSDEPTGEVGEVECGPNEELVDGVCRQRTRDVLPDSPAPDVDMGEEPDLEEVGDMAPEVVPECEVGERICFNDFVAAECNDQGVFDFEECLGSATCVDGFCEEPQTFCEPGESPGCADDTSFLLCNEAGNGYDTVPCPPETPNCLGSLGECSAQVCVPNSVRCGLEDPDTVEICNEDGSAWVFEMECPAGHVCDNGGCLSPCDANAKLPSFLGCDYWAIDLDNLAVRCDVFEEGCDFGETCDEATNICEPSAAGQQFSASISNPNDQAVEVTVTNVATGAETSVEVGPMTSSSIDLDRLDVDGTGLSRNAYRINATLPITAHQFNPANNLGVFSNDASLLLPSNVAGARYAVLTWPTGPYGYVDVAIGDPGNQGAFGYATIVAVSEGTTNVSVTPSVDVAAGGGVDAMAAGVAAEHALSFGDVLSLETIGLDGLDLSGTIITADQPIVVFAGHECAFVPDDQLYCDHVEQQLVPEEAWGTRYVAAKFSPRGGESDVWRVVASVDATLLRTVPPIDGVNGITLDAGQVHQFATTESFLIEGSSPILVGQFMVGSDDRHIPATCAANFGECGPDGACDAPLECDERFGYCVLPCRRKSDCNSVGLGSLKPSCPDELGVCAIGGVGDPAYVLAVPANQYRDNYVFLTPGGYRDDWVSIIAPDGTEVTFDGVPVPPGAFSPIGSSGFSVAYQSTAVPLGEPDLAEPHTVTGTAPFGLQVYGYDCDVSYAYPGGLNLETE